MKKILVTIAICITHFSGFAQRQQSSGTFEEHVCGKSPVYSGWSGSNKKPYYIQAENGYYYKVIYKQCDHCKRYYKVENKAKKQEYDEYIIEQKKLMNDTKN